jgi:Ras family protein A
VSLTQTLIIEPIDRRLSQGDKGHNSTGPIKLLRDNDQPYVFDIKLFNKSYRFEFYDTSSPDNWKLLQPNLIILCYDISNRLSLIDMQRRVRLFQTQLY